MSRVVLREGMDPGKAEAAVYTAAKTADRVVVRLNGFPSWRLRIIVDRLPGKWSKVGNGGEVTLTRRERVDVLRVFTANLDFANDPDRGDRADLRRLVGNRRATALLTQELASGQDKVTVLDRLLPDGWADSQRLGDSRNATAVAVGPDHRAGRSGYSRLLNPPPGVQMNTRHIAWQDVKLDGRMVRLASVHMPPKRYGWLWPVAAAAVVAFVRTSPHPVILGGDFNDDVNNGRRVAALARAAGLQRAGHGIDGFLYDRRLRLANTATVADALTRSDHPAFGGDFQWRR